MNLRCECPPNHIFDSRNNICTKIFGSYCEHDHYCSEGGDSELICAENRCRCRPNYKISEDNHFCTGFKCLKNLEYQIYDPNRVCDKYVCKCNSDTEDVDNLGKLCQKKSNYYYYYWLFLILLIPLSFAIYKAIKRLRSRNRKIDKRERRISTVMPFLHYIFSKPVNSRRLS